jgi:hypothetical protein
MIFARNGEPEMDVPPAAAPAPSGEAQAYCEWIEREVAPRPDHRCPIESHATLDHDDEDAAWTALLAHARTLAFEARNASEWEALLADIPD